MGNEFDQAAMGFGPAAAPRWFDSDIANLPQYLDLVADAGGSALEFVLLPGPGSDDAGRVHLLESQWSPAFSIAAERRFRINLHAPLLPEYRVDEHAIDPVRFWHRYQPVLDALKMVEEMQQHPPILVVHANGYKGDATVRFLDEALGQLAKMRCNANIAVELRVRAGEHDERFDRSLDSLMAVMERADGLRAGICWDIAHEWESYGRTSALDSEMAARIFHVHLHDNKPDRSVHAPLGVGQVPWRSAIQNLVEVGYRGSLTLEIRYRYASEFGEPWDVLRESLLSVGNELDSNACR